MSVQQHLNKDWSGKGGNMMCQQTSYLERELVHGVDFIEVVHYEVQ